MPETKSPDPKKIRKSESLPWLILGGFIMLAVIVSIAAFSFVKQMVMGWSISSLPGEPVPVNTGAPPINGTGTPSPVEEVPAAKPWNEKNRINILFLGLDYRDWEAGSTSRTDTMILFTYDPVTGDAATLTIPRDLWVNIPGFDFGKINTGYYLGESYHIPGGGPAVAMQTVSQFLGVPIDYFVQVDFNTFVKMIDLIGGVIVTPDQDVKVERIGNAESQQFLKAGQPVTLDGALTLSYARERHTSLDDFDRSRRQQQVIMAIRDRLLQFNNLPKLISRAPALYQEFSSGIKTNLDLQQIIQLGNSVVNLPKEKLHQFAISPGEVQISTSPDGLSILIPIPDDIRTVRDSVFPSAGSASPLALTPSPGEAIQSEGARVTIYNASGSAELGQRTSNLFAEKGLNIINVSDTGDTRAQSSIIINGSKPFAVAAVADLMRIDSSRIEYQYNPDSQTDITVILGQDWAVSIPQN
jgi:LCP family protein required for cell wall assembly